MSPETRDVCVVGGGVAGLTAGVFTARAGLDTIVLNTGEPILARNAHLENYPGFPAGVNGRLLLDMLRDQADRNGCLRRAGEVTAVEPADAERLSVSVADPVADLLADAVVCTSWSDTTYLAGLEAVGLVDRGSKTYVEVDDRGETGLPGLYAAGRIAGTHHQAIVAAGDGARVGLSVVQDSPLPYYRDWVVPEGYFTDRGREVPPGCEEIDAAERERREDAAREVMQDYFGEPHPDEPTPHPSQREE